ncbi:oxaloacetate decarboxylase [bacterium]|nr:oxaloacetate decarboxylase [bacterium]
MGKATRLRKLLKQEPILMAPGCHDALGAYFIQRAGFKIAYMTGYGVAASLLARPDLAELTMTEMVSHASRISSAIDIPLICDSDSGYGGALNVQRTVREYQKAGVAGIHIEDQVDPKRCAVMEGMQVVDLDAAVSRIKAAVAAKEDPDFIIIARTDCRPILGIDEAIKRVKAFAEVGADMVYVELMQSREELEKVGREVAEAPLVIDRFEHPIVPVLTASELQELGFKLVTFPMFSTLAYAKVLEEVYDEILIGEGTGHIIDKRMDLHAFEDIIKLKEIWEGTNNL